MELILIVVVILTWLYLTQAFWEMYLSKKRLKYRYMITHFYSEVIKIKEFRIKNIKVHKKLRSYNSSIKKTLKTNEGLFISLYVFSSSMLYLYIINSALIIHIIVVIIFLISMVSLISLCIEKFINSFNKSMLSMIFTSIFIILVGYLYFFQFHLYDFRERDFSFLTFYLSLFILIISLYFIIKMNYQVGKTHIVLILLTGFHALFIIASFFFHCWICFFLLPRDTIWCSCKCSYK